MKRTFSLFLAAVLALLLTACGAGSAGNAGNTGSSGGAMETDSWSFNSSQAADAELFGGALPEAPTGPAESAGSALAAGERKVIYTADIQMETTDFDAAVQALSGLVTDLSGYFESRSVSNYDAGRSGYYTIRVPAAQFEAFCTQAGQICHVTDLHTGEENVGEAYYDLEARLATQRTKLERLQALLSEADNMADIITIESAISDTELQIEYLTGSLRSYDALIDYSTINVSLREVYRLSNTAEPPQSFAGRIAGALRGGLDGAVTFFEETVILLARIWVLVLILAAAGIGFVLWRRRKHRLQKPAELPEEKK